MGCHKISGVKKFLLFLDTLLPGGITRCYIMFIFMRTKNIEFYQQIKPLEHVISFKPLLAKSLTTQGLYCAPTI